MVTVGAVDITLLHTPGHTPGSQCFLVDGKLVAGDTLFLEGCGRTDLPGSDPVKMFESLRRLAEVPDLVRRGHPESEHLYTAQIQLARFTRDQLGDPAAAAARLEHLLLDLDLPLEGVALARLALGESYLAASDTVRARQVLTALGASVAIYSAQVTGDAVTLDLLHPSQAAAAATSAAVLRSSNPSSGWRCRSRRTAIMRTWLQSRSIGSRRR